MVNSDKGLRRASSVALVLSWCALVLTLAGGVLTLIGSFDATIGSSTVLVRHADAYLPVPAARFGALPYLAFAIALWRLVAFLRLSREGRVFAAESTTHLRAFGRWLVAAAAAAMLVPLVGFVWYARASTAPDAAHAPALRVPLFTGLFVLAVAMLVMMICRVIDEGRRLRDELDEIV